MKLRQLLSTALLGAVLAPSLASAMVFAVNEGATYRVTDAEIQHKYKAVADDLSKLLGQKVTVVAVSDYKAIAEGLAAARFDLAYIHPSHLALGEEAGKRGGAVGGVGFRSRFAR